MSGFDPRGILESFAATGAEFVVVGGIAVQAHSPQRLTLDLDLAVSFSAENRSKIADALARIDARIVGPDGEVSAAPPSASLLAGGDIWFLTSNLGRLDLVAPPAGVGTFDEIRSRAVDVQLGDITVPVASREDLIAMKRASGRPQDLEDVRLLESLDG